jgi:hypothetical protein
VDAMDGIFSNEISNTLQYFTFPLEVIGLTLAAIEVRFPVLAKSIDSYCNYRKITPGNFFSLSSVISDVQDWSLFKSMPPTLIGILWLGFVYILITSSVLFGTVVRRGLSFEQGLPIALLAAPVLAVLLWMIDKVLVMIYRLTSNWVPGRTVGTLGIIIAGFGVLGEAYQFTALMLV